MKSLNHIFRTIWSEALGAWIAVSEITKAKGKRSASSCIRAVQAEAGPACAVGGDFRERLKPVAFALACCFAITAQANPVDGVVVNGQASFNTSGNTLTVTNTPGTIINWQGFSIGANEVTHFAQQSASSTVLNHVVTNNPSVILGTLSSNGQVFLVNANGIMFGAGSTVDVAGLVATTLNLSDADFLAGRHNYTAMPGAQNISNAGNINAQQGGQIYLIAPNVENNGIIKAPNGEILLAAGNSVELVNSNDPNLRVKITAPAGDATNLGQLIVGSGSLGLFGTVVKNSGTVSADSAIMQGGKIVFRASQSVEAGGKITANGTSGGSVNIVAEQSADPDAPGVVIHTGTIQAQGTAGAGGSVNVSGDNILSSAAIDAYGVESGGQISVLASHQAISTSSAHYSANSAQGSGGDILVAGGASNYSSGSYSANGFTGGDLVFAGNEIKLAGARIDARGTYGGGNIHVGGLMHGLTGFGAQGIEFGNATSVLTNSSTSLVADAILSGNGGQVVLWSDQAMSFKGSISATGGEFCGNGGVAEVSGLTSLGYGGLADLSAANGTNGTLLLDPNNLFIVAGASSGYSAMELIDPTIGAGEGFGNSMIELSGGNIVIGSGGDDFGGTNAGAVYLFSNTGSLVSTLVGSHANDALGTSITKLIGNGNIVVHGATWNGTIGAATWMNGATGQLSDGSVGGVVSAANSLVGSAAGDSVGSYGVYALSNGNYVVDSPGWNGSTGAATWVNGSNGHLADGNTGGQVSSVNSLAGSAAGDSIGSFGVTTLSNGNYVVLSPNWSPSILASNAGAVTWVNGSSGQLTTGGYGAQVSATNSLVGSVNNENVGNGGVYEITNGTFHNFYVRDANYGVSMGAITWMNGATGLLSNSSTGGQVSAANSLVGSTAGDQIGSNGIFLLHNGNYVVASQNWNNNGTASSAGAVTWVNGSNGQLVGGSGGGAVSSLNSLVGSRTNDRVGSGSISGGVYEITNGVFDNYVVSSPYWNNTMGAPVGAVTWGNGAAGTTGVVDNANSLTGNAANDQVGYSITVLHGNGNYVVESRYWNNTQQSFAAAGAVTWVNGSNGFIAGGSSVGDLVSLSNSLYGTHANDNVGSGNITALSNGNYVVSSPNWNSSAGAVTWGNGTNGMLSNLSIASDVVTNNSLVGSTADNVGNGGIVELTNGNFVVISSNWNNTGAGATLAGAVTWMNGANGHIVGGGSGDFVNSLNSLAGSTTNDMLGNFGVTALTNGNYVVGSSYWDSGTNVDVGAVTWGNGATGTTGTVSSLNSLVGSTTSDMVGSYGITPLANGNYVVLSPSWNNGTASLAGAVTWGNGATGTSGVVSSANSLVGTNQNDGVGGTGVILLTNNNFVVSSYSWSSLRGAITWMNGANGHLADGSAGGVVSAANSLVGGTANDQVGVFDDGESTLQNGVTALSNGDYVVQSSYWINAAFTNAGAVTMGNGSTGTTGVVSSSNSLVGTSTNEYMGSNVQVLTATSNLNTVFVGSGLSAQSGQAGAGRAYLLRGGASAGGISFSTNPGMAAFVGADWIANTLNLGTNVTLQANSDITQLAGAGITATGTGNLTLQAGRSVVLNDLVDINGNLVISANDAAADLGYRAKGAAVIDTSAASIAAASISFTNSGGDIITGALNTKSGTIDLISSNLVRVTGGMNSAGNITVAANAFENAWSGNPLNTAGRWLVYTKDPSLNTLGAITPGFELYGCTYAGGCLGNTIPANGNGLLYATGGSLKLSTPVLYALVDSTQSFDTEDGDDKREERRYQEGRGAKGRAAAAPSGTPKTVCQ